MRADTILSSISLAMKGLDDDHMGEASPNWLFISSLLTTAVIVALLVGILLAVAF